MHAATPDFVVVAHALTYMAQEEAKDAFKELLAYVNCRADWSWEQAMRATINDVRYGALKTVGEKKAAFNEYAQARRAEEREEERRKQRATKEEFTAMLLDDQGIKVRRSFLTLLACPGWG